MLGPINLNISTLAFAYSSPDMIADKSAAGESAGSDGKSMF